MNGLTAPAGAMYVRALYDYDADDRTSLSFRQGDIIQVITQLESGWWDGVIHGVRGWFPSNYCAVVNTPEDASTAHPTQHPLVAEAEEESEEEYGEHDLGPTSFGHGSNSNSRLHLDGANEGSHEEAAFWIPQATPDGRLFYFNTLTGVSTMELPLETPSNGNESGPRDRTNVYIPDQTRPPPELLAGGYEREEDDNGEANSDTEGAFTLGDSTASLVSSFLSALSSHLCSRLLSHVIVARTTQTASHLLLLWTH